MEKIEYQGVFGYLRIAPVTRIMNVDSVSSEMEEVKVHKFDMETAEKIALITGNKGIQVGVVDEKFCYLVHHESPSAVRVCRVDHIVFNSDEDPTDILNRLNQGQN